MKKKVVKKKAPPKIKHEILTRYLSSLYSKEFLKMIPKAAKQIKALKKELKFDAIAFTGTSGAGIGFPISYLLKIPVINVRKGFSAHYTGAIEGTISSKKYLIVDDLIASGATIRKIISTIEEELKGKAKPVGIFLYSQKRYFPFEKIPVIPLA